MWKNFKITDELIVEQLHLIIRIIFSALLGFSVTFSLFFVMTKKFDLGNITLTIGFLISVFVSVLLTFLQIKKYYNSEKEQSDKQL